MTDSHLTLKALKQIADFAVITIKPEEFEAVLDQFHSSEPGADLRIVKAARNYAVVQIPLREMATGVRPTATVAITQCGTQGNGVSQDVARDILREVQPQWILLVGIAGALPTTELSLGDVVLSTRVLDFSVEAVKSGAPRAFAVEGREPHYQVENYAGTVAAQRKLLGTWYHLTIEQDGKRKKLSYPPIPLDEPNFYGDDSWRGDARQSLVTHVERKPRVPLVAGVTIGSSDRLIKDTEIVRIWLQVARHVRAVEMESAGVHIAARGRGPGRRAVPAMSIRGISDIVGYRRDERWTLYACHSAAAFAYAFIRSGHVIPKADRHIAPKSGAARADSASRPRASAAPSRTPPPIVKPARSSNRRRVRTTTRSPAGPALALTKWDLQADTLSRIEPTLGDKARRFQPVFLLARSAGETAQDRARRGEVAMQEARSLLAGRIPTNLAAIGRAPLVLVATARRRRTTERNDGRGLGAELWNSGDQYYGEMVAKQASGVGVYQIYNTTYQHAPHLINMYRGEVWSGGYGQYGVYEFAGGDSFSGEWIDRRPRLGVYLCESQELRRGYTLYVGEMGESKRFVREPEGDDEGVFRRAWHPHGRGVALETDRRSIICGSFVEGLPASDILQISFD